MEQRIGVIGAGVMGKGVAQRFAKYGYRVILLDNNPEVLKNAAGEIYRDLCPFGYAHAKEDVADAAHLRRRISLCGILYSPGPNC